MQIFKMYEKNNISQLLNKHIEKMKMNILNTYLLNFKELLFEEESLLNV